MRLIGARSSMFRMGVTEGPRRRYRRTARTRFTSHVTGSSSRDPAKKYSNTTTRTTSNSVFTP